MHYTLDGHRGDGSLSYPKFNYRLSNCEITGILFTGLVCGGIPYAIRHLKIGHKDKTKSAGHIAIACVQLLPILGTIAALFEWIIVKAYNSYQNKKILFSTWKPTETMAPHVALARMQKNAAHAEEKFLLRNSKSSEVPYYATLEEIEASDKAFDADGAPLKYKYTVAENIGKRKTNQDGHFCENLNERFFIAGVIDGHGGHEDRRIGQEISQNLLKEIKISASQVGLYESKDEKIPLKIRQVFEKAVYLLQKKCLEEFCLNKIDVGGAAAVVSIIDKKTARLYTMTIGDCSVSIYRKFGGTLGHKKIITSSRLFDWSSSRENARLRVWLEEHLKKDKNFDKSKIDEIQEYLKRDAKKLRSGIYFNEKYIPYQGINLSRALFDVFCRGTKNRPLVLNKPVITVRQLIKGDDVVSACDGLDDFVPLEERITKVEKFRAGGKHLSNELVQASLARQKQVEGGDNVTVIAVSVR